MKPCTKCAERRKAVALKAEKMVKPVKGFVRTFINRTRKPK